MSALSLDDAIASHRAGSLEQAEERYRELLQARPDDAEAHRWLGLLLHQRGRDAEAHEVLARAVEMKPSSVANHVAFAIVLRALGRSTDAERACLNALALDAGCTAAVYQLGLLCTDSGDLEGAERHHRRAVALSPGLADVHHAWGVVLTRLNRDHEAIEAYRRAVELEPGHVAAIGNLANAFRRRQAYSEALPLYRRLLEIEPTNSLGAHMTAALSGGRSQGCPPEFVERLFDECADEFDAHLVDRLGYRTPARLAALVLEHVAASDRPFRRVLDLGCGTGLVGREIRLHCEQLVGVDLSPRMIAHAERTGLYDALVVGEVVDYLHRCSERDWDLAIAADAFPYVGELTPWLQALSETSAAAAWVAFSVEVPQRATADYVLSPTGRFAHDAGYVRRVATDAGFEVRASARGVLRREGDGEVEGDLWLLRHRRAE